ncbi:MAG: transporter substrate-binding domain-containing protein [Alphaproteobacteria bacterium]|nr:transporter substrate-binding domain-containing protein [Alphaproteobacteria bacterium]
MAGKQIILVIVLALLAGAGGAWFFAGTGARSGAPQADSSRESAFDRVMRTQTIRCGYTAAPPLLIRDPNTGALSGIAHDFMEALGKALSLKIDWAEETGWGSFPAALKGGRVDAFCTGAWSSAARARETDAGMPFSYQPYYAFVRAGDTRFDNRLEAINDPAITIALIDGDTSSIIAASDFPKAKAVQLPEMAHVDELFINVMTGKADVTFIDASFAAGFEANNPGKIRRVQAKTPLRVFGNVIFIAQGQDKFRRMLNTATQELLSSGQVEKILARYEKFPGAILRAAPGFRTEP